MCECVCVSGCVSLQVAFIIAGCTHTTYYKALSHSLGIDTVSAPTFMCTIRAMHSIVVECVRACVCVWCVMCSACVWVYECVGV